VLAQLQTNHRPEVRPAAIQSLPVKLEKSVLPHLPTEKPRTVQSETKTNQITAPQKLAVLNEQLTSIYQHQPQAAIEFITQLQTLPPSEIAKTINHLTSLSISPKSETTAQFITLTEQAQNLSQATQTYEQLKRVTSPEIAAKTVLASLSTQLEKQTFAQKLKFSPTTLTSTQAEDELMIHLRATIFKTKQFIRQVSTISYEIDPEVRKNRINTLIKAGQQANQELEDGTGAIDTGKIAAQLQSDQSPQHLSSILPNGQADGSWENTKLVTGKVGLVHTNDYSQLIGQIVDQNPPVRAVEIITNEEAKQADIERVLDGNYYRDQLPALLQQFSNRVAQVQIEMTQDGAILVPTN